MSRSRRQPETLESGSDSFLDIIANIVGILIILIVIAGVRVSNAPARTEPITKAVEQHSALVVVELPAPMPAVVVTPEPVIEFDISLGDLASFQPTGDDSLEKKNREIQKSLQAEKRRLAQLQQLQKKEQRAATQLQKTLKETEQKLSELALSQKKNAAEQNKEQSIAAGLIHNIADLNQQLVEVQRNRKPGQAIEHSILPVSHLVDGQEWHFELRGGRVSYIPLDEFMDRMRNRIQQKVSWIAKYEVYEGMIGPIVGYHMKFRASRQKRSLSDELTYGAGRVMIGLDKWELVPSSDENRESAEQAMRRNSLFRSELQRIAHNDTITFWVYPDSFPLYQKLVKIVHQQRQQVAARPLPAGRKITGSPHGSRSVSQ